MKLTPEQLREKRAQEEQKRIFQRKIEEDRLGISRKKQRRVMSFMSYRIIKLVLLAATGISLFIYTPAVLPLTVLNALMLFATKQIEREKNKHINKKYRIKIKATDSVIAILLIVLAVGVTAYSLITAYQNGGSLNTSALIEERLADSGFNQSQINAAIARRTGENSYERILDNFMSLLTGNRNVFRARRMIFRGSPPNFEGMGDTVMRKRPNVFTMMRNMPIEMLFRQIFYMACAVVVGVMVLVGVINVIESFKYGEIKRITLDKKYDAPTGANDPCPCGSGKKVKNCPCGGRWQRYG